MIYIAAPFFTPEQIREVIEIENELNRHHLKFFSPMRSGIIQDMSPREKQTLYKRVYLDNLIYMKASSVFVCIVDYLDPGTYFEIGYGVGRDKKIITYSVEEREANLMVTESACHITNLKNLIPAINGDYWNRQEATT